MENWDTFRLAELRVLIGEVGCWAPGTRMSARAEGIIMRSFTVNVLVSIYIVCLCILDAILELLMESCIGRLHLVM